MAQFRKVLLSIKSKLYNLTAYVDILRTNKKYTMRDYPKSHLLVCLILGACLLITVSYIPEDQSVSASPLVPAPTLEGQVQIAMDIAELDEAPVLDQETIVPGLGGPWQPMPIKSGDNLSALFKRHQLSATDLDTIIRLGPETDILKRIFPGKVLGYMKDDSDQLSALKYEISPLQTLMIYRTDKGFTADTRIVEPQTIVSFKTGKITAQNPSLYEAGLAAGLSENMIMKLSYIFQWDISFALDIRQGDSFTLMYEEIYAEGEKINDGDILAAMFTNQGEAHTAVMYENEKGRRDYFTPEGKSLRKAFIRDPVHFSHISSRFDPKRLHPIHKTVRPHRGIDYAAKRGTPILAAGDGKVLFARQNKSSGKYVVIQHGEQYQTKYLHMSNFANGIRSGKYVKQGQVIGYVGSTGWATGPHLHYEFLVNGVHRNPRRVKFPDASPISGNEKDRFEQTAVLTLARLYSLAGVENYATASSSKSNNKQG